MRLKHLWWSMLAAAVLGGLVGVAGVAAGEQFIPVLTIREGAGRSAGIPQANGFIDYLTLLNTRDGGINGVPLVWEECETVGDVTRVVECYERLKTKGPTGAAAIHAFNALLVYALTERATSDRLPLITLTAGPSEADDGRVFPYVFNAPVNMWSQITAQIRFMGQRAGGMEQLKGRKIVYLYYESDRGGIIPLLDTLASQYGFAVQHLVVQPPGLDQKATWLRIKVAQPD